MVIDFKKMAPSEDSIELQKILDAGALAELSRADIHELIEKRAEELRGEGESLAQSYTKFITTDPAGRVLFKAHQAAAGNTSRKRFDDCATIVISFGLRPHSERLKKCR